MFTCKNDNDCYGNGYCQARECKCSANYEYRQDCSHHGCKYFPCFHICLISISLFLGTRFQTFIRLYAHCSFLYFFLRWMFSLLLFCCVILFYVSEVVLLVGPFLLVHFYIWRQISELHSHRVHLLVLFLPVLIVCQNGISFLHWIQVLLPFSHLSFIEFIKVTHCCIA